VKIRAVRANPRKAQLEMRTFGGVTYPFPYARLDPAPSADDPIHEAYVDPELGREGVTYVLESGEEGSVHIDHALDYNADPGYRAELLVHQLTVEAGKRIARSGLSRREVARRLRTSLPQLYRLLDPGNTSKSLGQLVALLHVLDCEVQVVVRPRPAGARRARPARE
jgi:hypothetical protein